MKNLLTFFIFLSFTLSFSQEKKNDIKKLFDLINIQENTELRYKNYLDHLEQNIPINLDSEEKKENYKALIKDIMGELKKMSLKIVNNDLLNIYDKYYTHEDIIELIKFYDSPIGQKTLEVSPKISKDLINISQKYLPEFQEFITKKMNSLTQEN